MTPDEWNELLVLLYKAANSNQMCGEEQQKIQEAFDTISTALITESIWTPYRVAHHIQTQIGVNSHAD